MDEKKPSASESGGVQEVRDDKGAAALSRVKRREKNSAKTAKTTEEKTSANGEESVALEIAVPDACGAEPGAKRKRGRPKKEKELPVAEAAAENTTAEAVPSDTPKKRGRPKKEEVPTENATAAGERPRKRAKSPGKSEKKNRDDGAKAEKNRDVASAPCTIGTHDYRGWLEHVFPLLFPEVSNGPSPKATVAVDGTLVLDWGGAVGHVMFMSVDLAAWKAFFRCSSPVDGVFLERCEESEFSLADDAERAEVSSVMRREFAALRSPKRSGNAFR